jgi:hypothetical protein
MKSILKKHFKLFIISNLFLIITGNIAHANTTDTVYLNKDGFNVLVANKGSKVENKITWIVYVPEEADYLVAFQYTSKKFRHDLTKQSSVNNDGLDPNCGIRIEANEKILYTKLKPLFSYNESPKVYGKRQWFEELLPLEKGMNKITFHFAKEDVDMETLSESSIPIKFYDIALIRPEVWNSMKLRAEKLKPDLSWMIEGKYGIFTHWSLLSYPLYGDKRARESFEWGVNNFDVEAYANKIEETGASWVIFTTCHGGQMFPAPIKTLNDVMPGRTTERDLIAEIAEALNKRNIKLLLYYGFSSKGAVAEKLGADKNPEKWLQYIVDFVSEVSLRYGKSIAGWGYFDGTVPAYNMNMPWENFYMAAIAGNPDAVVGISSHWRAQLSPFNNLQTGDSGGYLTDPLDKRLFGKGERYEGLQEHAIFILDDFWYSREPFNGIIRASSEVEGGPTFTDQEYITYFKKMADAKVPVTVNILITQDVTSKQPFMNPKSIELMKKVKIELDK